jgi:hypothetical protein
MQPASPVATQAISSTAAPIEERSATPNATNDPVWWRAMPPPRHEPQGDLQREQALLDEMIDSSEGILNDTIEADSLQESFYSDEPEIHQAIEPNEPLSYEPLSDVLLSYQPLSDAPLSEEPLVVELLVDEPFSEESLAEEPLSEEPLVEEPLSEELLVQEPLADEPLADAPLSAEPLAEKPSQQELPARELPSNELPIDEPPSNEPPPEKEPARESQTVNPKPAAALPIAAQPVEVSPAPKVWPPSIALVEQIKNLSPNAPVQTWSNHVLSELTSLKELDTLAAPAAAIHFKRLRVLIGRSDRLTNELPHRSEQMALRQAAYSLQRRLDVWKNVHDASQAEQIGLPQKVYSSIRGETMLAKISDIRQSLSHFVAADDWEQYLLLNQLERTAQGQGPFQGAARVELAQLALDRFHDPNLSVQQRSVLETPPVIQLNQELRLWATYPVSHTKLLAALERFEQQPTPATARELTNYWRDLRWSALPSQNQLAQSLDKHYRNANIRFAVSEEMLNRLVPAVREFNSPIRDQVLGAQVKGHSNTRLRLLVNLLPDRSRLRVMFEARGVLAAQTAATKGPVTLFSRNRSNYSVRKTILWDSSGPRFERSQAIASGDSNLTGLRTIYDHLPFIGSFVRNQARQQHQEQTGIARRIFVNRVRDEARTRVDNQIEDELVQARLRLEKKIIQPLRQLDLQPQALEMKTLEDRMILRGRLASSHQLAAYTARPRAHSENHLSVQIHESALNNFVEQLGLDGREAELRELYQDIAAKLGSEEATIPPEIPAGVRIRFAKEGAVRVVCDNEAVTLTLRIAELRPKGEPAWKNFEVYADYRPQQTDGSGVDLYFSRDGGIRLSRTRRRFGLRAIFTKVLSQNRKFHLIKPELAQDERLADLNVTQLRITDGWIGLSIGKESRSTSAARRQTSQRQTAGRQATRRQMARRQSTRR